MLLSSSPSSCRKLSQNIRIVQIGTAVSISFGFSNHALHIHIFRITIIISMTRMSVPHTDVDVTFPHYTSLPPYFGNHPPAFEQRDHHDLPSEKTSSTGIYELLQARTDNDDESKYGFWGELDETKSSSEVDSSYNKRSFVSELATFCSFWCAFSVLMLGAFGLYFAVDLAFSRYGLGTGMAEWAIHRHQLPPSTSYGVSRLQHGSGIDTQHADS